MKSEKQLISLIKSARVLTSTLDLDQVLHQLLNEVLNVIEGAHAGILFIYDEKRKKLVITEGVGFDLDYLHQIELKPDEGMTGKTFTTKKPQIFSRIHDTTRGMENIQPNNQENFHKASGESHHYPVSTICAPLLSKEGCIGVLTIDSFSEEVLFNEQDLLILETFAAQATIALENAKLFSQHERSKHIHSELAQASFAKVGLKQLTVTLAGLINRNVCLFNEFMDFIAASSSETEQMGKRAVSEYTPEFKKMIDNPQIQFNSLVNESLHLFPIKSDKFTIGVLAIFGEEQDKLDSLDLLAIDLASNVLALEMMGQERMLSDLSEYEGYLLEQLLNHKLESFTLPQKAIVGISETNRYICANIKITNQLLPFQELNSKRQYFNRLLKRELQHFKYKVLVSDRNMEYDLLVIINDNKAEDEIFKMVSDFFASLDRKLEETISFVFFVGLGRVFHELKEIQASYRDALRCTEYIHLNGAKEIVFTYKDLGIYRLFLKSKRDDLEDFVSDTIGPLVEYDQKNGTELVHTLITYLECHQNITLTANKSFVHINTIKYRLAKIKEILESDSLEGRAYFELQLAIYLHGYLQNK
jgi:sugar diacid utilization regulator/putative methionine-R-sulfoxide reductase with GAF domain